MNFKNMPDLRSQQQRKQGDDFKLNNIGIKNFKNMKILFVQDSLGAGGAEKSNADLWYFLKENGISMKIVLLNHNDDGLQQEILDNGFEVVFLEPDNYIKQAKDIAQIIREYQPDIVQSVLYRATMRVRGAKFFTNFFHLESLVSCPYDDIRFQDPQVNSMGLRVYKLFDRLSESKGTDTFVALTEEIKKHYIEQLNVPADKIIVIPRGRKENTFLADKEQVRKEKRAELGLGKEDLVFVHVGRQEYAKGHLDILKAIAKVDEELLRYRARFIFCGKKGNETSYIEDLLKKEKIQTEIKFLGHRNDIYKILVASDVFVFPSLYEGIGGGLIEAQAAGLPIICSDLRPFYEVVEKNGNALFFERRNILELCNCLLKMAESKDLRQKMGDRSIEIYNLNFKIEKIHSKMLNLYQEIRNNKNDIGH